MEKETEQEIARRKMLAEHGKRLRRRRDKEGELVCRTVVGSIDLSASTSTSEPNKLSSSSTAETASSSNDGKPGTSAAISGPGVKMKKTTTRREGRDQDGNGPISMDDKKPLNGIGLTMHNSAFRNSCRVLLQA